ncbi:MAG: protein kinase [Myxococcales bacterium]|nr:protein kinase [Myxococcales bacterium]
MKQPIPFGKFLLLERINVGGMAEIFLARTKGVQGFRRILAIKKILPTMAEDKEFTDMFVDEARIASELSHAGIVQIFELGKYVDDYYIAMEFVHGKDLRYIQERMARERKPLPLNLTVFIAFKICEALDYAHTKKDPSGRPLGIIHRDISPQNVIISFEGEVKICDFGIAKAANRSQKTQAGVLKGKFGYMSPEQVRGLPLDGRSDIFTVGTLLYEMVTLERLFIGESDFSTLEKVRNADVVPPSAYNREVPEDLEEIILKALAKEVEDRFQNAAEFGEALQGFLLERQTMVSSRDLSTFMKKTFSPELEAELRRLEEYQAMPDPPPGAVAAAETEAEPEAESAPGDDNAKTMIFASREPGGAAPPPLPAAGERPASIPPWEKQPDTKSLKPVAAVPSPDAKTMIFTDGARPELTDAKTMIFADPEAQPEPITDRGPRPQLQVIPGGQDVPRPSHGPSVRERLFFPLAVLAALLLGWSIYATVAASRGREDAAPTRLEIQSSPALGIELLLDGQKVASETPFSVDNLPAGKHQVRITRKGYEAVERSVFIEGGTRVLLDLALSKLPEEAPPPPPVKPPPPPPITEVLFESEPPGAMVSVNGKKLGETPLRVRDLAPGPERLAVFTARGFDKASQKFEVREGQENRVRVVLQRLAGAKTPGVKPPPPPPPVKPPPAPRKEEFGFLLANTVPWSKVYVDGEYTGRETPIAPDKKIRLPAGRHKVSFETSSGKRFDFEIEIEAGKDTKLIKRLE